LNETEQRYELVSDYCKRCYNYSKPNRGDLEKQLDEVYTKPNLFVKKLSAYVRAATHMLAEWIHAVDVKAERAPYKTLANTHADEILIKNPESKLRENIEHWQDMCKIGNCYRARICLIEKKQ